MKFIRLVVSNLFSVGFSEKFYSLNWFDSLNIGHRIEKNANRKDYKKRSKLAKVYYYFCINGILCSAENSTTNWVKFHRSPVITLKELFSDHSFIHDRPRQPLIAYYRPCGLDLATAACSRINKLSSHNLHLYHASDTKQKKILHQPNLTVRFSTHLKLKSCIACKFYI